MTKQAKQAEQVIQISVEALSPDPGNRKIGGFDKVRLEQLAESIKAVGVQQPAVVRKAQGDSYEIVAGERRWRAAKIAGLATLPCVVRDLDDVTVLKIRTIENLQREDVHPLDEADGFARLLEKAVYDAEHLAQEVGKSVSYVYQRLRLLDLISPAREMLVKGKMTAGHAILIARLQPDQQKEVLTYCVRRGESQAPSVCELDEYIRENILMDLAKTVFRKDDADLVPQAGACTICQKRTGSQPALFADVCKKDYCGDPACFQKKLDALLVIRGKELAGTAHLLVQEQYNNEKNLPKGALAPINWAECKAKEKGAVRCLVIDGVGRGRLTWGHKRESYHSAPLSPQQKAAEQKKKRELQFKRDVRRKVWDEIFAKLPAETSVVLTLELMRIIVAEIWARLWHDSRKAFAAIEGWEKPKKKPNDYSDGREAQGQAVIASLDRTGLSVFMAKIALVHYLNVSEYDRTDPKGLISAALAVGLNPKDIEAKARKEAAAQSKAKAKPKARPAVKR